MSAFETSGWVSSRFLLHNCFTLCLGEKKDFYITKFKWEIFYKMLLFR